MIQVPAEVQRRRQASETAREPAPVATVRREQQGKLRWGQSMALSEKAVAQWWEQLPLRLELMIPDGLRTPNWGVSRQGCQSGRAAWRRWQGLKQLQGPEGQQEVRCCWQLERPSPSLLPSTGWGCRLVGSRIHSLLWSGRSQVVGGVSAVGWHRGPAARGCKCAKPTIVPHQETCLLLRSPEKENHQAWPPPPALWLRT